MSLAITLIFSITALDLNGVVRVLNFDVAEGDVGDSGYAMAVAHGIGFDADGFGGGNHGGV